MAKSSQRDRKKHIAPKYQGVLQNYLEIVLQHAFSLMGHKK